MRSFLLALQFLTVFRIHRNLNFRPQDFSSSLRWFFVTGLLLGLLQWLLACALLRVHCPLDLLAVLLVITGLVSTGGLHLDGVADTADGFGAGTDRESVLGMMKDKRTGVYGIAAISLSLLMKFLAFSHVLNAGSLIMLAMSPMLSRALIAATCTTLPYARQEGTGKAFSEGSFVKHAVPSLFLCVIILFYFLGRSGVYLFGIVCAVALLFGMYCYLKIRGFTGDTLGAQNEIAEITALFSGGLMH
ncbi:adenosylcobinamide-GDP ribazoletransferase [bacterium]|nr:adenosylcobinamide-GDP ribazoletransferase [bacterium]